MIVGEQASMASRAERRQSHRMHFCTHATYIPVGAHAGAASVTRDVSIDGINLLTDCRLSVGSVLQVDVKYPNRARPIRMLCRVVWSQPLVRPGSVRRARAFETGGRLLDIAPEDQALINQLPS